MSPSKLASATFQTLLTLPKSYYLGFKAHNILNFALVQVSQQLPNIHQLQNYLRLAVLRFSYDNETFLNIELL